MNLKAFTQLAVLGRKLGVDLWNYETPDGRSIPKAFAFLAPYVSGEKPWPHPQLGSIRGALRGLRSHFESTIEIFELPDP